MTARMPAGDATSSVQPKNEPEGTSMPLDPNIRNARELAGWIGANYHDDSDESDLETSMSRRIYKDTSCGAWLALQGVETGTATGVAVGSIVEGSDATTSIHEIAFPFLLSEFWKAVGRVEEEADYIWNQALD